MSKKDSQNFMNKNKLQNKLINNVKTNKKQEKPNENGRKKLDL